MTRDNQRDAIALELERSAACLDEARILLGSSRPEGATSRLYYALFHAAVALLLTEGIEPRTHAGVVGLLGQHFVRTGRLSADDARCLARIQKYRHEADYGRSFTVTLDAARRDLADGEAFLARVRDLVAAAGFPA